MNRPVPLTDRADPSPLAAAKRAVGPVLLAAVAHATAQVPAVPGPPDEPAQRVEIRSRAPDDDEIRRRDPVGTTVIGRAELERYGDTRLGDVLSRQPGLTMAGGLPRLRGLGNGYTQVLVNGEPPPPGFSLDDLSPDQVERVEIVKGATAQHSAQAVAGTVNVVLRQPPRKRQREAKLGLSKNGPNPVGWGSLTLGERIGAVDVFSPLSAYAWEWIQRVRIDRVSRDAAGDSQRLAIAGDSGGRGLGASWGPRLAWAPNASDRLNLQGFVQRHRSRYAGDTADQVLQGLPPPSVVDRVRNESRWQFQRATLGWQHRADDGSRIEARLGAQSSLSAFDNHADGWDGALSQTVRRRNVGDSRERGASAALNGSWPLGEIWTVAAGAETDWRRRREQRTVTDFDVEQIVGIDGQPFEARIDRSALFAQMEWRGAGGLSGNLGLRGERLSTASVGPADTIASTAAVVSPSLHLVWRPDPARREQWRLGLSRSYRAPDPASLLARPSVNPNVPLNATNPASEPDRVGNPALRPELATGIDLAWERPFAEGASFTASAFARRIAHTFRTALALETPSWASAPRWVQRPSNAEAAITRGLEFELKGRAGALPGSPFDPALGLELRLALNLYRSAVAGVPGPDNRIEGQPGRSVNAGFDYRAPGGGPGFGASLAWTPAFTTRTADDRWSFTGTDQRLDAYAFWALGPGASLRLSFSNLLPRDAVATSTVVDSQGLAQGSDTRRESRRRGSATLELKW